MKLGSWSDRVREGFQDQLLWLILCAEDLVCLRTESNYCRILFIDVLHLFMLCNICFNDAKIATLVYVSSV